MKPPDGYLTKILKYIPAEIVAAYLVLDGLVRGAPDVSIHWAIVIGCVILAPLYLLAANLKEKGKRHIAPLDWFHVITAPFAFAVWVLALGGPFVAFPWYSPLLGSVVLVFFTLTIPAIDTIIEARA